MNWTVNWRLSLHHTYSVSELNTHQIQHRFRWGTLNLVRSSNSSALVDSLCEMYNYNRRQLYIVGLNQSQSLWYCCVIDDMYSDGWRLVPTFSPNIFHLLDQYILKLIQIIDQWFQFKWKTNGYLLEWTLFFFLHLNYIGCVFVYTGWIIDLLSRNVSTHLALPAEYMVLPAFYLSLFL